jgi:uncharacterized membrane protein YgdD (TMEM256/DUF423 family)
MKNSMAIGAYSMALAIVLGAFGAHGLKNIVTALKFSTKPSTIKSFIP